EAEAALVRPGRSFETCAGELRRGDSRGTGPARMYALVPGPLFEELLAASGRAAREALRRHELTRRQAVEPARLPRAGEMADDSGRVVAVVMEMPACRIAYPRRDLDAEDIGCEEGAPGRVDGLGDAEGARKGARGSVDDRADVRIVVV